MKIFFCETNDDGTVGGSHACMYNLIKHMDRSGIKFVVGFYSDNSYVPGYKELGVDVKILPLRNPLRSGNIILRKALNWYRLEYKAQRYLENYLRREGFDLVVLNNSIFASLPFVKVCKKLSLPVIVYERGIGYFEKKHIRSTIDIQASIPVSRAVKQFLSDYNYKAKIIEIIYDGVDPSGYRVNRSTAEIKNKLNIPVASRVIGIVGNIRPWKGQKYFVEGFEKLSEQYDDIYGLVVGGCATEDRTFETSLKETVRKAGLQDRLIFLGYRRDVPELLSILDVFVHASTKPEPFGMVILEAIAAKKPVVATGLGGPIEILNNGECGILVPPRDGKRIAEACMKYLDDPVFKQEMVNKAYERLNTQFHINQTVNQTVSLYERICNLKHTTTCESPYCAPFLC